MAKGILRIKLLGDAAGLDKTLSGAGGSLGKFGKLAAGAALGVATAVAGAAVGVGKFAFDSAQQIDSAMDNIRVGTGATGDALEGLGDSFKTVFKGVPASAEDVGKAIADLNTRTGATGEQLETLATKATLLAQITGEDLGGQIAATTRVFGDWGIAAEDQAGALDYLFKVSQSTGIGVSELSEKVVQFGAPMRQLGFSFDETAALMGKFEKEGVNLETVMAGMRKGLATFAKAGEAPAEALQRAADAIKNAGSQAEANKIAIEVFGARAGPDMAAAIREGRFEVEELLTTLKESPETIEAAAEATWDFGEKWQMVKNKLSVALEPLGAFMMDVLAKLADFASAYLPKVIGFFEGLAGKAKESGMSFAMVGDALNLLNPIMGIFKEMWPALQPLIQQVTGLLMDLAAKVLPILSEAWNLVMEVVTPILQAYLDLVMSVFPTILETIKTVMDAILPIIQGVLGFLRDLWQEHGDKIMAIVKTVFGTIQEVITAVMGVIQGIINVVMGVISGDWSRAWEGVKQIFGGVWDAIKAIITGALDAIKALLAAALGILKSLWSVAWNGIKTVGEGIWNGIKAAAATIWNGIKDTLSGIWNAIKGAFQGMWDAMKGMWETATGWIRAIPDKIKGFFSGAATLLYDIGKSIINGLWNGLKSAFEAVGSWFKSIGGWFKSWKGPIEKDRRLLVPEGRAIMEGLHEGLESQLPGIKKLLGGLSADMNVSALVGAATGTQLASAAGGGGTYITGGITVYITGQGTAAGEAAADALIKRLAAAGVRL